MTEKITIAEYKAMIGAKKKKHPCRLHVHESATERDDCNKLQMQVRLGEIESFKWQVRIPIGDGKFWCIDFGINKKGMSPKYADLFSYYFESKGWNRSNEMADFKLKMSLQHYPERIIYWNWNLVPPLDSAGRLRLKDYKKRLNDKELWTKKIKEEIRRKSFTLSGKAR